MEPTDSEIFKVVIPRNGNSEILLVREGSGFVLPKVTIPKWQRVAQCVTESVADLWSLKSLCLFQPELPKKSGEKEYNNYVVMESRDPYWQPSPNFIWVQRNELCENPQSLPDGDVLEEILKEADSYNAGNVPGPFARSGWLDNLISWAQDHLRSYDLSLTGKFRQFNGHPFFTLIRLETNGPALWFKAVGEPNHHEYSITVSLAERCPQYFPKVVAARPDWHGWLMEEESGHPLEQAMGPKAWSIAASSLGRMQFDFASQTDWLLAIGCMDFRIPTMLGKVDSFLELMRDLMERQPSNSPPSLGRAELQELGEFLKRACCRLQELGIPSSLGHCDANPGNIIVRDQRHSVFLDWAEAYVGFPFATFEYIRLASEKYIPQGDLPKDLLEDSYVKAWETVISPESIAEALTLTPVLAVYLAALSADKPRDPRGERSAHTAKWLRSLTRRMHREVRSVTNSGATCTIS